MKFNRQSSSLQLFKLAFSSARFDLRRILITLSLIFIFVMGSLYIINQVYKDDKSFSKEKAESSEKSRKKQLVKSKTVVKPVSISPELLQKEKQRSVEQLQSNLQAQAFATSRVKLYRKKQPRKRYKLEEQKKAYRKLNRHQSVLTHSNEEQLLYSENPSLSPPPEEEEDVPSPPKKGPGFWSGLGKDFKDVLRDIFK